MYTLILQCCFGFSVSQLKTAWPILEYAFPVWGPQVNNTSYLSDQFESLQKRAFKVILSDAYVSYESVLSVLQLLSLHRGFLCLMCKFGNFFLEGKNTERNYVRTNRFANLFILFYMSAFNKLWSSVFFFFSLQVLAPFSWNFILNYNCLSFQMVIFVVKTSKIAQSIENSKD